MLASYFNYNADAARDARLDDRHETLIPARLALTTGELVRISVMNVSKSGFMAACDSDLQPGDVVDFEMIGHLPLTANVRWAHDARIGCQFRKPLSWEIFVTICKSHGVAGRGS